MRFSYNTILKHSEAAKQTTDEFLFHNNAEIKLEWNNYSINFEIDHKTVLINQAIYQVTIQQITRCFTFILWTLTSLFPVQLTT